eukprot:TRINITY_DN7663_c1_g1_i1.p1 TRINITY_DN7663_c1_g1~~TRINITY_DN7663_c1_g1_i1.p1  ORF type:complete len:205 (+),score=31.07 TRINITY_DN7663_c1_g1_i1:146-760(+)
MTDVVIFKNKTPTLLDSVNALCGLSVDRLSGFCSRVLEVMTEGGREPPFTEQEEKSLAKKLKRDNVQGVVHAVEYIFEQFAYHSVTKESMEAALLDIGMTEEGVQGVGEAWGVSGKAYLNKVRNHTIGGPLVLTNISYDSQLHVSDVTGPKHEPNAILQLHLSELDGGSHVHDETVSIRFNHEQLYDFFKQIDHIQEQIDGIAS